MMAESDNMDSLVKIVQRGIEAEAFLSGTVGRYLVKRAEEERDAALEQLKSVSPKDEATITKLQNEIWRAESVQTWLAEIIQEGWNAESMIQQNDVVD